MTDAASEAGPLVLVVEDEPQVARFLRKGLVAHGYRVVAAATASDALREAAAWVPDVVLLDLGLPDRDGLGVTADLRAWSRAPILVLSARGQESAKVHAPDAGADDYLTKPFGFPELLARLRVALRHAARASPAAPEGRFETRDLCVDLDARRVTVDGELVKLTPIEYRLLAMLVRHAGKVVTHRQLLEEVWGPKSADERQCLRVYMTHLRRKLERGRGGPPVFETEAGVGYRLVWDDHT